MCCDGEGIGYAQKWKDRIVIPIVDENNKLLGCTARYIYDCDKSFKVRKIKGSDISKTLYGLRWIKKGSPLIGVEGEIDVMTLQQYDIPAIKTGKFLSKEMIKTILNFTDEFIYCPDGDVPWINKNIKQEKDSVSWQLKRLKKYMNVKYIELPDRKDPNDLSEKQIKEIFGKYIDRNYFKII